MRHARCLHHSNKLESKESVLKYHLLSSGLMTISGMFSILFAMKYVFVSVDACMFICMYVCMNVRKFKRIPSTFIAVRIYYASIVRSLYLQKKRLC